MDLKEMISSEDYLSILVQSYLSASGPYFARFPEDSALLPINSQYSALYVRRSLLPENLYSVVPFSGVPRAFTTLSTLSLDVSGITQVQNLYGGGYTGRNTIIGILDTGIDYRHPAFLDARGRTRILSIWDQTGKTGTPPERFPYGSEYTREDIQKALSLSNPLELVPVTDPDGHGTFLAGVAAGTPDEAQSFSGAAPNAELAVVKLRPMKQNLRSFYLLPPNAVAFAEDDLLTALSYLTSLAERENKPIVLLVAVGTNQGSHSGTLPISQVLSRYGDVHGIVPVTATGNEGNAAHHFFGSGNQDISPRDVEILVPAGSRGFFLELWGQAPQLFSIGFRSPAGEVIPRIPVTLNQTQKISFVLERTVIEVTYEVVQAASGSQLILVRIADPTPGIWSLQVYASFPESLNFHVWLPVSGFTNPDITFLEPDPYTTLTTPSVTSNLISPSTYQASNNSFYPNSGRGFGRLGERKPDFSAPGVAVTGPGPAGSYQNRTGSSGSAAITAGAVALLMEWGMMRSPIQYFTSEEAKTYLILGASRFPGISYPSREWGYGLLNLYQTFETLKTR